MKNTTFDLNNYLFEQIERLQDDNLTDEELEKEIKRSKAVTSVAETIVKNGQLQLQAATFRKTWYGADEEVPLLGINMKKDHK